MSKSSIGKNIPNLLLVAVCMIVPIFDHMWNYLSAIAEIYSLNITKTQGLDFTLADPEKAN
jgi:hypothetical protein